MAGASSRFLHQVVYGCVILIFLAGLGFIGHLTWTECLRLLVIQAGLTALYMRHQGELRKAGADGGRLHLGAVMVALTVVFVVTQFDPATSAVAFRELQKRVNPFFLATMGLAGVMMGAFLVLHGVRLRDLTVLDWIAAGVILGVVGISLGLKQFLGPGISKADLLGKGKILGYLLIWFPVTRVYAEPIGKGPGLLDRWRGTFLGMTLLSTVAILYGGYRVREVIYHVEAGRKLLRAEMLEAAQQHYDFAQKLDETVDLGSVREDGLHDLAVFHLKRGDEKKAEEAIGALQGKTYDQAEAHRKAGDVYADAGRWVQAVTAYEEFFKTAARDKRVLDRLGDACLHLRDSQRFLRIIERYQYVPKVEVRTYDEQIFLGNVHFYRKDFAGALRCFEAAAQLKPEDAYPVYKVGRTCLEQGKLELAIAQFQKAVTLKPGFADAFYRLGTCHEKQGQREEAIRMYEKTVELLPNHLESLLALQRLGQK